MKLTTEIFLLIAVLITMGSAAAETSDDTPDCPEGYYQCGTNLCCPK